MLNRPPCHAELGRAQQFIHNTLGAHTSAGQSPPSLELNNDT
jgi:hypothetical protein